MTGFFLIISVLILLISFVVSSRLKNKFKKYSESHLRSNLSGKEIAEKMLADHGIRDVRVISVEGHLTDHYNPVDKTVNLSPEVYHERNVAAAAVASHECGHAVQHANAYSMLQMRSALVPMVSFASRWMQWVILAGLLLIGMGIGRGLLIAGIVLFAFTTIFSFITLPVEFDASRRALAWIRTNNVVTLEEHVMAKDALKWAALTYVVAAIGSLATLLYYVSIYLNRR
jgi:Zn-dependent membrane protease YugP